MIVKVHETKMGDGGAAQAIALELEADLNADPTDEMLRIYPYNCFWSRSTPNRNRRGERLASYRQAHSFGFRV